MLQTLDMKMLRLLRPNTNEYICKNVSINPSGGRQPLRTAKTRSFSEAARLSAYRITPSSCRASDFPQRTSFRTARAAHSNTTVLAPLMMTRSCKCNATARASTRRSTSRPFRTISSGVSRCVTGSTSCEMIGPSSRSEVT